MNKPSVGTTWRSAVSADLRLNLLFILLPGNLAWNSAHYWDWRDWHED
jgi:hypothetical protein